MTPADIAIAIGIGLFVFSGFYEGIVKKLFGLIVLIVSFFVAVRTYSIFAEWLTASFSMSSLLASIVAFLIIFLFILIAGNVVYRISGKKNELFVAWDRLAGSCFGFLEGVIIVSLFLHLLSVANIPSEPMREKSILYPLVYGVAPYVFEAIHIFVPQVREFFELFIKDIDATGNLTV